MNKKRLKSLLTSLVLAVKKRQLLVGAIIASFLIVGNCSEKASAITHFAQVQLDPSRYSILIDAIDTEMARFGLHRYGATPDLSAIKSRDVLYANYRFHQSEKSWFLTVDDVKKVGILELRVYSTLLKSEQERRQAIVRIDSVLATFGTKLTLRTAAPQN